MYSINEQHQVEYLNLLCYHPPTKYKPSLSATATADNGLCGLHARTLFSRHGVRVPGPPPASTHALVFLLFFCGLWRTFLPAAC